METQEVLENPFGDYEYFKRAFLKLSGIDLNSYKENQMKRRINTMLSKKGVSSYKEYILKLRETPGEMTFFTDYITINVTEFFRTGDQWNYMAQNALKELSERQRPIRAWSAACATGEEPYSLAISMKENYPQSDIEIYATDINDTVLSQAKLGRFSDRQMEKVPDAIKNKYFAFRDKYYEISDEIKSMVKFEKLDLLKPERYPKNMDLILSRNVLIYFTDTAKDMVFMEFNKSLAENGYLFTGHTEQIIYYKKMNYQRVKPFLYKKTRLGGGRGK